MQVTEKRKSQTGVTDAIREEEVGVWKLTGPSDHCVAIELVSFISFLKAKFIPPTDGNQNYLNLFEKGSAVKYFFNE